MGPWVLINARWYNLLTSLESKGSKFSFEQHQRVADVHHPREADDIGELLK